MRKNNMGDIKIGEYIRTSSGVIAILKRIEFDKVDKDLKWYFYDKKESDINIVKEWCINKPYIVKHSPNIIDIIQIGDFVNGLEVQEFDYYEDGKMLGIPLYTPDGLFNTIEGYVSLKEMNIKEILTKEKYKQNCFEVVE